MHKNNQNSIINPKTGRPILINGPTYQKLLAQGYNLKYQKRFTRDQPSKRYKDTPNDNLEEILDLPIGQRNHSGNVTRGWGQVAPMQGKQRKKLLTKCGARCFLRPESLSFPICPNEKCEIDCRGINSAYIRAAQWKYKNIENLAKTIRHQKCSK